MNLGELRTELALIIQDARLESFFTDWLNLAILEIARDFSLPALKLKEPVTLVTTESNWLYDLPDSYHKNLYRCVDSNYNMVTLRRNLDDIDGLDIDHSETGNSVSDAAVRDLQIGIYPKANDTLSLWYYELPAELSDDSDTPTCIPKEFHYRVIVSKVIIKAYHLLMDMSTNAPHQSLLWWKNNYSEGLFGGRGGDVGFINCLVRQRKPKTRGGRNPLP